MHVLILKSIVNSNYAKTVSKIIIIIIYFLNYACVINIHNTHFCNDIALFHKFLFLPNLCGIKAISHVLLDLF